MITSLYELFGREISGQNAKRMATDIARTDHTCSYSAFAKTAKYCEQVMEEIGLSDVERLRFPADGRTVYGDHRMGKAWDADFAELRLVEPKRQEQILCSYLDEPLSLAMYSGSTPKGGVTAEAVVVEGGSQEKDYRGIDVRGKFMLTNLHVGGVAGVARKRGAAGVLSDHMPAFPPARDTAFDLPEGRVWQRVKPEDRCPAFVLSPKLGHQVREMIRRGPVKLHAEVQSRAYDGEIYAVTGVIPGRRQEQEFLIVSHLFEPGANDNASGAACSLEVARCIRHLIATERLPRPERTIRFLLPQEFYTTVAFAQTQRGTIRKTVAALNPDMVGEDQALCRSAMIYQRTPDACPSFMNPFMAWTFGFVADRFVRPETATKEPYYYAFDADYWGNDCFLSDPVIGVPTLGFIDWPDRFYHTSLDVPDHIDPASIGRFGTICATMTTFIASAGPREARWLAEVAAFGAERDLARAAQEVVTQSYDAGADAGALLSGLAGRLAYLLDRETAAIRSVLTLLPRSARVKATPHLEGLVEGVRASAQRHETHARRALGADAAGPSPKRLSALERQAAGLVLRRTIPSPLTFQGLRPAAQKAMAALRRKGIPKNFLFWIDGKRSLLDIQRKCAVESGRADLKTLMQYAAFLEKHRYLERVK